MQAKNRKRRRDGLVATLSAASVLALLPVAATADVPTPKPATVTAHPATQTVTPQVAGSPSSQGAPSPSSGPSRGPAPSVPTTPPASPVPATPSRGSSTPAYSDSGPGALPSGDGMQAAAEGVRGLPAPSDWYDCKVGCQQAWEQYYMALYPTEGMRGASDTLGMIRENIALMRAGYQDQTLEERANAEEDKRRKIVNMTEEEFVGAVVLLVQTIAGWNPLAFCGRGSVGEFANPKCPK